MTRESDPAFFRDQTHRSHEMLGIIDHGTRLLVHLQQIRRFCAWSFLGHVCLAIARYGKPAALISDNHPVFRSRRVQQGLNLLGIRQHFSAPTKPRQNGRIERYFGTFKAILKDYKIQWKHLATALIDYTSWYNVIRPHQHGFTPMQAWCKINTFRTRPKVIEYFSAWGWTLTRFLFTALANRRQHTNITFIHTIYWHKIDCPGYARPYGKTAYFLGKAPESTYLFPFANSVTN